MAICNNTLVLTGVGIHYPLCSIAGGNREDLIQQLIGNHGALAGLIGAGSAQLGYSIGRATGIAEVLGLLLHFHRGGTGHRTVAAPGIDLTAEAQDSHVPARDRDLAYRLVQHNLAGDRGVLSRRSDPVISGIDNIFPAQLVIGIFTKGPQTAVTANDCSGIAAGSDPPGVVHGYPSGQQLGGHVSYHSAVPVQDFGLVSGGSAVTQLAIAVVAPSPDIAVAVQSHCMGVTGGYSHDIPQICGLIDNLVGCHLLIIRIILGIQNTGHDLHRLGLSLCLLSKAAEAIHSLAAILQIFT